jgi:hypothetical protein
MHSKIAKARPILNCIRAKWERGGMVYYKAGQCVNLAEALFTDDSEAIGSGNALSA